MQSLQGHTEEMTFKVKFPVAVELEGMQQFQPKGLRAPNIILHRDYGAVDQPPGFALVG